MNPVSIIIPAVSYNNELKSCLRSILRQNYSSLEVWVIFNPVLPSIDLSPWPSWVHFAHSEKGVNKARNKGLELAKNDLTLFLDSDCELQAEDHIQKMVHFFDLHQDAAGIGGGYVINENTSIETKAYNYIQMSWLGSQIKSDDWQARALIGGHMMFKRSKWNGQKFDPAILYGGSEKELFARIESLGLKFYLNLNLNVLHNSEVSRADLIMKARLQSQGEQLIRSRFPQNQISGVGYIIKTPIPVGLNAAIEAYEREFWKQDRKSKFQNRLQLFMLKLTEHFRVAQSRRD